MAKIARFNGDVRAFGSTATGTDRTIFGDVTQSDALDDNINADFLTGWGILTAGAKPPKQYFNGALYTATQLIAYLHEVGIPEWNTNQKFYTRSLTLGSDGVVYSSVTGTDQTPNTGTNPATVTDETVWKIAANPYKEGSAIHDITVDADYTLTALENKHGRIEITDTGVLLTTGRNVIVDNVQRRINFTNSTAQTLTVKTAAGTGVAIPAGGSSMLINNGTNVTLLTTAAPTSDYELVNKKYVDDSVVTTVASTAEAQAQTADNVFITPLKLKEALQGANQSLAANGYQKLPGGLIIQWGKALSVPSVTATTVFLPLTFPNAALVSIAVPTDASGGGADELGAWSYVINSSSIGVGHGMASTEDVNWIAIGY